MPPSSATFSIFIIISLCFISTSPTAAGEANPTVYQVLESYDFPVGLLPKGVTSYEIDEGTGKFTVYLNKTCTFSIDGYNLRYRTRITGVISKDRLSKLTGVQVQVLFLWLNIAEVTRDAGQLDFSVGIASADFPLDSFYESPQCGCGFDCVNAVAEMGIPKFNWKRLVSSS